MKKVNVIEIKEEVSIIQEDGTKVVLEKGDKIQVLKEGYKEKGEAEEIWASPVKSVDQVFYLTYPDESWAYAIEDPSNVVLFSDDMYAPFQRPQGMYEGDRVLDTLEQLILKYGKRI